MPILTLNFSLKPHSKVNVYLDGDFKLTAKASEQVRLETEKGRHRIRLVQFRGRNENSPSAFGAVPYFGGGTMLNGDGTKSPHLIPWRATAHYCKCEFSAEIDTDCSVAVLSTVEKRRGFIGVDNLFVALRIGTADKTEPVDISTIGLDKAGKKRFYAWQRAILLMTYLPVLALAVWQLAVALSNMNSPIMFGITGRYYIAFPILIFAVMLLRIAFFLKRLKREQKFDR